MYLDPSVILVSKSGSLNICPEFEEPQFFLEDFMSLYDQKF